MPVGVAGWGWLDPLGLTFAQVKPPPYFCWGWKPWLERDISAVFVMGDPGLTVVFCSDGTIRDVFVWQVDNLKKGCNHADPLQELS